VATLLSPGVSVTVTDESFYNTAGQGTVPLILIATASNKASPVAGAGIAPSTAPAQANKLYLATSQRDLIQNFGAPIFYSTQGTPLNGFELNEYGLFAAYSYLGVKNQAYILRADIDLSALAATTTPPTGPPLAGTYWFDLANSTYGVFRANGSTSPGSAWNPVTVLVALAANVSTTTTTETLTNGDVLVYNLPSPGFGVSGNVAIAPLTSSGYLAQIYLYENISGIWYRIGSIATSIYSLQPPTGAPSVANPATVAWASQRPTIVTGTATRTVIPSANTIVINNVSVPILANATIGDVITDINNATIPYIVATATNGALTLTNTIGGSIAITDVFDGNALNLLGITEGTTLGVTLFPSNGAAYPSGAVANSFWLKGNPANNGANWVIKYYNASLAQFTILTAPFYPFVSTLPEGNPAKDMAIGLVLGTPVTGNVYVGYDTTTYELELRRWSGPSLTYPTGSWLSLNVLPDEVAPSTPPVAGTMFFNTNFTVDIMYGNGSNWIGYNHQFPATDPNGPQIAGSAPLTHSDGVTALANGDLWIDSTNLENYPALYIYNTQTQIWTLVDNTDQTTPYGIVFADARADSGIPFTGIPNPGSFTPDQGSYLYRSSNAADLAQSDFVDPDAPDPRTFPAGMMLWNTRVSTYNVKEYQPSWFTAGNYSTTTDYTTVGYTVGAPGYSFASLSTANQETPDRWVTKSGNKIDGSPYMGRKAQRIVIVEALSSAIIENQDIRSEIVFFNLTAVPGYPELIPEMISLNTDMNNIALNVGDTPARLAADGTSIQNWAKNAADATVTGEDALTVSDPYTAIYYPWGLGVNLDGSEIMIPPSTMALNTIAYNDQVAYPWYAPAGFNRGLVSNATSVGYLNSTTGEFTATILNQGQRDTIYVNSINPIAYIPGRGLVVYGQKTLDPISSALDRINVARLINYINYNLDIIFKPFLFEPNTTTVRKTVTATAERFFDSLVGLNGLYDYAVVCDGTNNTPDRIDQNQLWVDCAIQPVKAIEFIFVPVRILSTQATS